MFGERAQSEVVGVVILTGIVAVTVAVAGASYLDGLERDSGPNLAVRASVATDEVAVTHAGGETIAAADLTVVVGADGETIRVPFEDGTIENGDADGRFESGERWRCAAAFAPGDRIRLSLVHEPTGTTAFEGRLFV